MPSKIKIDEDLCASAYNRGSSVQELATANGVSYGTMHRILSARDDVQMRKTGVGGARQALLDERSGVQRGPTGTKQRVPPRPPGRIIRARISELGITQAVAARRLGIPPSDLSMIIRGRRSITVVMARRLQAMLRIDAEHLLIGQVRWNLHQLGLPEDLSEEP